MRKSGETPAKTGSARVRDNEVGAIGRGGWLMRRPSSLPPRRPRHAPGGTVKAVIISLDLLIASSIASIAILLLLASVRASQSYLLDVAGYQNRSMGIVAASQEIAAALDSPATNLSVSAAVSGGIASEHGLESRLGAPGDIAECHSPMAVCRFVTFSGSTYLLVVSNESPSKS